MGFKRKNGSVTIMRGIFQVLEYFAEINGAAADGQMCIAAAEIVMEMKLAKIRSENFQPNIQFGRRPDKIRPHDA